MSSVDAVNIEALLPRLRGGLPLEVRARSPQDLRRVLFRYAGTPVLLGVPCYTTPGATFDEGILPVTVFGRPVLPDPDLAPGMVSLRAPGGSAEVLPYDPARGDLMFSDDPHDLRTRGKPGVSRPLAQYGMI